MKRIIAALLIAAGLLIHTTPASAEGQGPCTGWFSNVRPSMPNSKIVEHTKAMIECAIRRFGPVSESTAFYVADRESSFYPWALNPSGCAGVYQHQLDYWGGRLAAWWNPRWFWRQPSAFNLRANVIVTMRMVRASGWGPWAS